VETSVSTRFRQRIRALRKQRGWTQEQAAERCGIGQKLFQLYELGIKPNPGLRTLEKIAKGFNVQPHELLAPEPPRGVKSRIKKASASRRRR
jgi:transcriptional regulator with XRE-family HTH domain